MKNLNKHRKAITEAGYTLSKDGTQVTNKSGKTVAGTNDNGFFSGSSTLTNIFKGDTKAKGKEAKAEPKAKSASTSSTPKTSSRPPSTRKDSTGGRSRYKSASPAGISTLMSQGGNNAETREKGPERSGAYSVPVAKEADKPSGRNNARGPEVTSPVSGKPTSGGRNNARGRVEAQGPEQGKLKGFSWPEYENLTRRQRQRNRLPLNLDKDAWDLRLKLGS
jgi:hypothetical protein